jgi:ATP-dependent Clp protease adaptor protein ClpS
MADGTALQNDLKEKTGLKKPKLFKVILHNDDYTTMDFVVEVIISIFNKPVTEATKIMLDVHKKGKGIVGVYTYDIATTKSSAVAILAEERNYPLKATVEEA